MPIRLPVDDLYGVLGVAPTATREEIAVAFRARARELHPDANTEADPTSAQQIEERFKRLSHAYRVLRDADQRARYDAARHRADPSAPAAPGPPPPVARPFQLTRRGARWLVAAGVALVVLGIAAAAWVVSLQRRDADLRARGVPVVATVVEVDGQRRLEFVTRDGRTIRTLERAKSGEAQPGRGAEVPIFYDRDDPTRIVTEESHIGRDLTLWMVAAKFLIGGGVVTVVGARRLRRLRRVPDLAHEGFPRVT